MPRLTRVVALALVACLLVACGSHPVPLAARRGATFSIALGGDTTSAPPGFGGAVLAARGIHDDQRGELLFLLRDPDTGAEHPLVTRFVMRVQPDPASELALRGRVQHVLEPLLGFGLAQVVALVDVPDDPAIAPGRYLLEARRRRRLSPAGGFEWLEPPPGLYTELEILPGVASPTPLQGFAGPASEDLAPYLSQAVPHPKLVLHVETPRAVHAGTLDLAWPAERLEVLAAHEERHAGRSSWVGWRAGPGAGRGTLHWVAPEGDVEALALVFRLLDPFGAGRAEPDDFVATRSVFYDALGEAVPEARLVPGRIR